MCILIVVVNLTSPFIKTFLQWVHYHWNCAVQPFELLHSSCKLCRSSQIPDCRGRDFFQYMFCMLVALRPSRLPLVSIQQKARLGVRVSPAGRVDLSQTSPTRSIHPVFGIFHRSVWSKTHTNQWIWSYRPAATCQICISTCRDKINPKSREPVATPGRTCRKAVF
jgi:hypothetical protein